MTTTTKLASTPEQVAAKVGRYYLERTALKAIETPIGIRLCALGQLDNLRTAILIRKPEAGPILA